MEIRQPDFIAYRKIICSRHQWLNMDREEKVKEECKKRQDNPPKLTKLQKKLNNLITLQTV
tara:strand:+ start:333 stop:515 length:183 start_codon:yes stop_codon:yes gene_type:complete